MNPREPDSEMHAHPGENTHSGGLGRLSQRTAWATALRPGDQGPKEDL